MSKIEWTNETWNIITGCKKISEGCRNCYAATMHKCLTAMKQEKYKFPFENIVFHYDELARVFKGKHKMVFVNSMSDTFNEKISGEQITKILAACGAQPQHEFQILTKRAERLPGFSYPDNVWLGVTVENAQHKNRIDYLRQTNAKVKFLSCEPLLDDLGDLDLEGIHWVIAGGESGKNVRPCNPQWVRNIQKQCKKAGVPFFFKQWGEWLPARDETTLGDLLNPKNKNAYCLFDGLYFRRVGKGNAGCLLDGKLYREMPLMATVEVNIV
ncbi:MAG: phage Gp37/Gp68 family protein [Bacteroidales bacterium]|nr:phage Gp37/Gp68 family protein [Bacteroidales bacterium]